MAKKLKITQVRSIIHSQEKKHKVVMESLGFKRNYRTLYKNDNPQIRGMLEKVRHLVAVVEIDEKDIPAPVKKTAGFTVIEAARPDAGAPAEAAGADEEE
ncbi:MAG: 50S ribosomal protein L30 [Bacteroidales bacterium]|nr:50S ribosomal protein L30 [Candidatus Latescibacterota bacterium]